MSVTLFSPYSHPFRARYRGRCKKCHRVVAIGTLVSKVDTGGVVHVECRDELKPRQEETLRDLPAVPQRCARCGTKQLAAEEKYCAECYPAPAAAPVQWTVR